MKELARRVAILGSITVSLIMELRLLDQIRNDERVLLGQRMNTGKFIIATIHASIDYLLLICDNFVSSL